MRVAVQRLPAIWQTSGSLALSASAASDSVWSKGYSRAVGIIISSASSKAGSGLRICQSSDSGTNFDYCTDFEISACSGSAFSVEVVGDMIKIEYRTDSEAAEFRTLWQLRPI
jgi:hypothetical protein